MCAASGYLPVAVDYATDYTSSLVLLVAGVRTTLGSCNIMLCYPVTVRTCTALLTALEYSLTGVTVVIQFSAFAYVHTRKFHMNLPARAVVNSLLLAAVYDRVATVCCTILLRYVPTGTALLGYNICSTTISLRGFVGATDTKAYI